MKIPKVPFKAVCIKSFNLTPQPDGKYLAWGCLELLRIYEFNFIKENLVTKVKNVSSLSGYKLNEYTDGFYIAVKRNDSLPSRPYLFDYFIILNE